MGECINMRRIGGGGQRKTLPILNANFPADVSVEYGGSASFKVEIATDGYPAEYTYRWYVDDVAVVDATNTEFEANGLSEGSHSIRCDVTNKAGTVQSRTATLTAGGKLPNYTFSGGHQLIDDGNGNWRLKLTSSGDLKFTNRGTGINGVDIFLVGGGGGGTQHNEAYFGGHGGGGGYTQTYAGKSMAKDTVYWVDVGAGGGSEANGGTSAINALGVSAAGGYTGSDTTYGPGGNGGSGGGGGGYNYNLGAGNGGSDGGNGGVGHSGNSGGGAGQGRTTREFGASGATLYAGGGAGGYGAHKDGVLGSVAYGGAGGGGNSGQPGTNGLGGGGGGGNANYGAGGKGGSGIVIIRNKR
jgi:hypothetical protein